MTGYLKHAAAFLLCLALLLPCAFASGERFEIVETPLDLPEGTSLIDFSPDGRTAILSDGSALYTLRDGAAKRIEADFDRGVPDKYDKLKRLLDGTPATQIGPQGLVWASNGRYALYLNGEYALVNGRFIYDLFILDADEGEIFLAYTTPILLRDGSGVVANACFSEDGDTVYFSRFGGSMSYPYRCSLLSYNLSTGATKMLLNHEQFLFRSGLFIDAEDRLSCPLDSIRADEARGLLVYTKKTGDGSWSSGRTRWKARCLKPVNTV